MIRNHIPVKSDPLQKTDTFQIPHKNPVKSVPDLLCILRCKKRLRLIPENMRHRQIHFHSRLLQAFTDQKSFRCPEEISLHRAVHINPMDPPIFFRECFHCPELFDRFCQNRQFRSVFYRSFICILVYNLFPVAKYRSVLPVFRICSQFPMILPADLFF